MNPIKILILEDDLYDQGLLEYELKKSGLDYLSTVVSTQIAFEAALDFFNPDLILSDYSLPGFDGLTAYHIVQKISPEIPFIIVSGTIGDQNAVELIRRGITDYVLKENLYQLMPKITRALNEAEVRRKEYVISEKLKRSQQQLQRIMDSSLDLICTINESGDFIRVNKASEEILGYRPEEMEGKSYRDFTVNDESGHDVLDTRTRVAGSENRWRRKDGRMVMMSWSIRWDAEEKVCYCVGRDVTRLKEAADLIENSERRFRTLLENSTDGLALIGTGGNFMEISDTGKKIIGPSGHEIMVPVKPEIVHAEDFPELSRTFSDVLSNPWLVGNIEYRLLTPEGRYIWIEATFQNQFDQPAVEAIVMNFRDVTERKVRIEALQASEERYRNLFHNNPTPMWIYDMETLRFLVVNQAAVEKYGYAKEEFLAMKITDIRPEEDIEHLKTFTGIRTSYGTRYTGYWRHCTRNGQILHVDITSQLIGFEGRKANLILANDVTEKIIAEQELNAAEAIRGLIMDSALDAIICMDLGGRVTLWNTRAESLFGWSKEEVLGKELAEYIIPERYRQQHRAELKRYHETGNASFMNNIVEVAAINCNQVEFPIELTIIPLEQSGVPFFCAFIRDITERRDHLKAIENQNKRLREIAWIQSHVVRAPLARILGLVAVLKNSTDEDTNNELLTHIFTSTTDLDQVIREIIAKTEQVENQLQTKL